MTTDSKAVFGEGEGQAHRHSWCQPGDDPVRRWVVLFEDADQGRATFDNEAAAREYFDRADSGGWNCYLLAAEPRSGAGEGEQAALGWLFHNPDTGTEWSLDHPVEIGEVPDAEEIRPATLAALKDEMLSAWQGLEEEREAHALSARERNLFATEARALSPPAPAEHGVEIRELHAALSKGHALLCESGPDRCWVKIGFGWLQDAQDAHGALARFIKDGVPAALPPLMAAFSFPQPQRSRMYDVLRQLGQAAIRSQKITDHDAASAAQRECLSEIEALVSEALSQGGEAGRSEKGKGEEEGPRALMLDAITQARGALHLDAMKDEAGKPYGTTTAALEALAAAEAALTRASKEAAR